MNQQNLDASAKDKNTKEVEAESELAFRLADRYISIHEVEGGYDYSIMFDKYLVL